MIFLDQGVAYSVMPAGRPGDICTLHVGSAAERDANARLIAAAPDLLTALMDACAHLVAATSLLAASPKTAAPSNKIFDQMVKDYEASAERACAAIAQAIGQ